MEPYIVLFPFTDGSPIFWGSIVGWGVVALVFLNSKPK
jgi:uncharacterized membrane protein